LKLFMDIDQTLLYSFRVGQRKPEMKPDARIALTKEDTYDLYFRPDIELLETVPFTIVSSGGSAYVLAIADLLHRRGFMVEGFHDVNDLPKYPEDVKPTITDEPAVLIDDLRRGQAGVEAKLAVLPGTVHRQVDPWIEKIAPKIQPGESMRDYLARPKKVILELVRTEESRSFEECLEGFI